MQFDDPRWYKLQTALTKTMIADMNHVPRYLPVLFGPRVIPRLTSRHRNFENIILNLTSLRWSSLKNLYKKNSFIAGISISIFYQRMRENLLVDQVRNKI